MYVLVIFLRSQTSSLYLLELDFKRSQNYGAVKPEVLVKNKIIYKNSIVGFQPSKNLD